MQEIEVGGLADLEHLYGQAQRVGRVVKQRVGGDFHLVEVDASPGGIEADGEGIADEMDLVTAGRQFHAQLGGDDA